MSLTLPCTTNCRSQPNRSSSSADSSSASIRPQIHHPVSVRLRIRPPSELDRVASIFRARNRNRDPTTISRRVGDAGKRCVETAGKRAGKASGRDGGNFKQQRAARQMRSEMIKLAPFFFCRPRILHSLCTRDRRVGGNTGEETNGNKKFGCKKRTRSNVSVREVPRKKMADFALRPRTARTARGREPAASLRDDEIRT